MTEKRRVGAVRRGLVLAAAGLLLGQGALVLGAAGTAQAAPSAALSATATTATATATVCGKDLAALGKPPLGLAFTGLRKVYRAGGSWSRFTLRARNRTGAACHGVLPVVVLGSRAAPLGQGDVRIQWRSAKGTAWHRSSVVAEDGVLVALAGPGRGVTLPAKGRTALPLRMRFAGGAPTGQWVTLAIGFEPVDLAGETTAFPVGVSDPHYFRVQRRGTGSGGGTHRTDRPQLARTGGSGQTGAAAAGAVMALGGGAALVGYARRRGAAGRDGAGAA